MLNFKSRTIYRGFTIVELLVVIVVIGILATITIVSYTGISQRAIIASLTSDLDNASKQLKLFQIDNSNYPTTIDCSIPDSSTNKCIKASVGTSYQYIPYNRAIPQSFCITANNNQNIYKITDTSTSEPGDCNTYRLLLSLDASNSSSYPGSGTAWTDMSGNNNHVTLINGVSYSGSNGGYLIFDGINDYGITNNNFIINPASLTVSSWFNKTSSNATYNCAVHKGSDSSIGQSEYWMGVETSGKLTATIGARSGVGWAAGQTDIDGGLGSWWNLVATWDGTTVKVYVNGQFNKQYDLSSYPSIVYPTRMGASSDGSNYQFPGLISNVQIYDRALSSSEITQNFNSLKGRYGL